MGYRSDTCVDNGHAEFPERHKLVQVGLDSSPIVTPCSIDSIMGTVEKGEDQPRSLESGGESS